jgi:predicted dithiol-disulfide oxidoreductase (DUF899 family)
MTAHSIVSRTEWEAARIDFLAREKEFTKMRDALSQARRELPWVLVDKPYRFETEEGPQSLGELFGRASQLIVYHFMFGPDWKDGCKSCSFWADNFNGITAHLAQRDARLVAVSRAPLATLLTFRERMGWSFPWVSSLGSDFNFDFGVSFSREDLDAGRARYNYAKKRFPTEEAPGVSVFRREGDGAIYHTYSAYARGLDLMNTAYNYLDLLPKGRDEDALPYTMAWVKLHDQYD